jgi:hypothetical protein
LDGGYEGGGGLPTQCHSFFIRSQGARHGCIPLMGASGFLVGGGPGRLVGEPVPAGASSGFRKSLAPESSDPSLTWRLAWRDFPKSNPPSRWLLSEPALIPFRS